MYTYCQKCQELGWNPPEIVPQHSKDSVPLCMYHSDVKQKKYDDIKNFNNNIFEKIKDAISRDMPCNLSGTIFPNNINFSNFDNFPPLNLAFCTFHGNVTFQNVNFQEHGGTIFSHSIFLKSISFRSASFFGDLRFDYCIVNGTASFKHLVWGGVETSFDFSRFKNYTSFRLSNFKSKSISFKQTQFSETADFFGCNFDGDTDFTGATFGAAAYFTATKYKKKCTFQRNVFHGASDFLGANFLSKAIFNKILFNENANADFSRTQYAKVFFKDVHFKAPVDFSRMRVSYACFFIKTTFQTEVVFSESHFYKIAVFLKARFSKLAQFDRSEFKVIIIYKKTIFLETALFLDCSFPTEDGKIEFAYCHIYEQHKIRIHDTNLERFRVFNIDLSSFKFENCTWPKDRDGFLSVYEEKNYAGDDKNKKIESVFRSLKKNAISSRSEFQASDWHYKEKLYAYKNLLASKRTIPPARYIFFNFFFKAYKISSGFGERPAQALLILLILLAIPAAAYTCLAVQNTGFSLRINDDTAYSIAKKCLYYIPFVKVPPSTTSLASNQVSLSYVELVLSSISQVLLAIQTTLFALALRNRFRR